MSDLFQSLRPPVESIADGVTVLAGFADTASLLAYLPDIQAAADFRNMHTPGGKKISVAVTNCGALGWVSDQRGYRYQATDPLTGQRWAPMPEAWHQIARDAAALAGFQNFHPNACLINRYLPGNRMTAHQDKNERDFSQPVVTISTGLAGEFRIWGEERVGAATGVPVYDGDVLVMGGPARLWYHGVNTIKADPSGHPPHRISLTFRNA